MSEFNELGLAETLLANLKREGYEHPTKIQSAAIPPLIEGRDLLGIAQTGTGKTAAFALPIIQRLTANPSAPRRGTCRALVLAPTRELASQIEESFRTYGRGLKLATAAIFGGVGHRPQIDAIRRGLDVLVATPGRLLDHIEARHLNLGETTIFVLDEADQMLDMGFIHSIRKIVPKLPKPRQTLFFSATMSKETGHLADMLLTDPVRVTVAPVATVAERIEQRVVFVGVPEKRDLLAKTLREENGVRTLVFTRTKHGADRVVRQLAQSDIASTAIHGNKSQAQREKALAGFRSGKTPVLVATDIAARGIDVDEVSHIINFDIPNVPEVYVHRIGRTARAGAQGVAISFCSPDEKADLRAIEKLTGLDLTTNATREGSSGDWQPRMDAGRPGKQKQKGEAHRAAGERDGDRVRNDRPKRRRRRGGSGNGAGGRAGGDAGQVRAPGIAGVPFLAKARRPDRSAGAGRDQRP